MLALDNIESVHNTASAAAAKATANWISAHGDRDCCGFAWVTVREKGSTKLGRALKSVGFKPAYGGGLQLWNPSGNSTQSITAKEEGADAYAKVLKQYGVDAYSGSRMD